MPDFRKFIQFSIPNFFKKWTSPDGKVKGVVVGCQAGKYSVWSVLWIWNEEKALFYPSHPSKEWVTPIIKDLNPEEYDYLTYIINK
jgi:hypothetical protein